jgi:hypothetical protein
MEFSNQHCFADVKQHIKLCHLKTQQQIQLSQASLTDIFKQDFESLTLNAADQIKQSKEPPTTTH